MIWLCILCFLAYFVLIAFFGYGIIKTPEYNSIAKEATTSFSVIIPFRNEAENLLQLLNSIAEIQYPKEKVEFLLIDDDSSDNSVEIIKKHIAIFSKNNNIIHTIRILNNKRTSSSPKKDAITTGISEAKHDWIVTTDADCLLPKKWLQTFNDFILEKQPKMIVAPVNYTVCNSFLEGFQLLDFLSLQGVTMGSHKMEFPFLCNGANLAYKKDTFLALNGFTNNNMIASGDDVFLLEKFIKHDKNSVAFLKSKAVIVTTFPVKKWGDLVNQRVRWASKTSAYALPFSKITGGVVLGVHFTLASLFLSLNFQLFLMFMLLKIMVDVLIFIPTITFYHQKKVFLKYYLLSSILYSFFSLFIVLRAIFYKYTWKDRLFKK